MSINPVSGIGANGEAHLAEANLRLGPARSSAGEEDSTPPDPGTSPSPEVHNPQNVPLSPQLPQDEVQVQRDSGADNEIVIKYVDHSGNVILQVPSSEVLGLARAISEDLQQEAKARAASSAQTDGEGGKTHGH
jgi:hypothetical protein